MQMLEWQLAVLIQYLEYNAYEVLEIIKPVILNILQNFHLQEYFISRWNKHVKVSKKAKNMNQYI